MWLSPTQVRFIPVGDEFVSDCKVFMEDLNKVSKYRYIRVDIDDREESVSRKIRDAEKEWIPLIIVVGDKERNSKTFNPRFRSIDIGDSNKSYSIKELHEIIMKNVKDFPHEPLSLPFYLSKRPRFKG